MSAKSVTYRILSVLVALAMAATLIVYPDRSVQALATGISDFYIPTSSEQIVDIFIDNDNDANAIIEANGMRYIIGLTAYMDDTVIYYDHWENGYGFNPSGMTGADETYYGDHGDVLSFISYNVPISRLAAPNEPIAACGAGSSNPNGATTNCYDGRDHVYVAGGVAASLTVWTETVGTAYALSWALYPTKPFETSYTIPVGENLTGYLDFSNTYVIVQSTADNNLVTIDDPQYPGIEVSTTLNTGDVTQLYHIYSGTQVSATYPVQTLYIAGQYHTDNARELRGYTAVPTVLWNNEYFSPVSGRTGGNGTDLYIYNPGSSQTLTWQDLSGSGSFTIGAGATLAYSDAAVANHKVPADSGVRLTGTGDFHVIGSADTEAGSYEWGFNLLPSDLLASEYFLGWAPGTSATPPANNCSPVWVTATQNNTAVSVDYSPADGIYDITYVLDQLESKRIYDPDNNNTGMNLVANGPFAAAWGQAGINQSGASCASTAPNMDLGYTVVPYRDEFVDVVLGLDKTADPTLIQNQAGQVVEFTLSVWTDAFATNDVDVVDTLPANWQYVDDSAVITFPDNSIWSGNAADPTTIAGQVLTWDLNVDMPSGEALTIVFDAITTAAPNGSSINEATASGVSSGLVFTAMDNATVNISDIQVQKFSNVTGLVGPGDIIDYSLTLTNVSLFSHDTLVVRDPLPAGTTYVPNTTVVTGLEEGGTFLDQFTTQSYGNNDGTETWASNWVEGGAESGDNPAADRIQVIGGTLRFHDIIDAGPSYSIRRAADLSGAISAVLSCSITSTQNLESTDTLVIAVSPDGTTWTDLVTISGNVTGTRYIDQDISAYATANTQIRLTATNYFGTGSSEYLYVDDIQIAIQETVTKDNDPVTPYVALVNGVPPDLVLAGDGFNLPAGESMTVTYSVQVNDPLELGLMDIENEAYSSNADDPRESKGSVTDPLDVIDVSLTGSVSDPTPEMEDVVTFTLQVANPTGFETATNLTVTDVVPDGYTYVPGTITGGSTRNDGSPAGTGLTWTIASLSAGSSVDLTYQATVLANGTYNNYAEITAYSQYDYDSRANNHQQSPDEDDDVTVLVTVSNSPSLNVTASTDVSSVYAAGDVIVYTVNVDNTGDVTLDGISVTDPDVVLTYTSGDSDSDGRLDVTETWVYTGSYTVTQADMDAGGMIHGVVTADSNETSPDTAITDVTITQSPALNVTASTDVSSVDAAGDVIVYTINVDNTGNISLTGITVTDPDVTLTYSSGDTHNTGVLDVDETWVYTGSYTVTQADMDAGGTIHGVVTADSTQSSSDTAETDVTVTQSPSLNVTASTDVSSVDAAGDVIVYTVNVDNTGNVTLDDITVTDPDVVLTYTSGDSDSDGRLDVTEIWVYTGSYTVTQTDMDAGGTIHGVVTADSTQSSTDTAETDVTVTQTADFLAVLSADPLIVTAADEEITYTLTLQNTGNVTLTGITLTDTPDLVWTLSGDLDGDGNLDIDEIWEYTATYTVTQADIDSGGPIHAEVMVDTNEGESETVQVDVTVTHNPSMNITADTDVTSVNAAGDVITYTVYLDNTGNIDLTNVDVSNSDVPLIYASGDTDLDGELGIDEVWVYTGSYSVTQDDLDAGGTIVKVMSADTFETVVDTFSTNVTVVQTPTLNVTVTPDVSSVDEAGDLIVYTVNVENTGNVSLTSVTVTDPDVTLTYSSGDTHNPGVLDVDETWVYTGSYTVTQTDMDAGGTIHGVVTADSTQSPSDTAETDVTVIQNPDLLVSLASDVANVTAPGEVITYTLTVENNGNVALTGITLTDIPDFTWVLTGDTDLDGELDVAETWVYTTSYIVTQQDINAAIPIHIEATLDTTQLEPETVQVDVTVANEAPTVVADGYDMHWSDAGMVVVLENGVLANDSDANLNPITAEMVSDGSYGTVSLAADGSFTYDSTPGYKGTGDSFTYRAYDGIVYSDPVQVTITFTNTLPVGGIDFYETLWCNDSAGLCSQPFHQLDVTMEDGILSNDEDPDGDPIENYQFLGGLTSDEGVLYLNPEGSFTFIPAPFFHGNATFIYRLYDGYQYSLPVTVTIHVKVWQVFHPGIIK
jgi:uncharacterized repeat protein (TIGR01451 family)